MSQDKPVLTPVGKYIELYREHCGTNPQLSNQECEVINRLADWSALDRQGWISVEERLPREGQLVALSNPMRDVTQAGYRSTQGSTTPGGYWCVAGERALRLESFTYWLNLPPAPHASAQTGEEINEPPQAGQSDCTAPSASNPELTAAPSQEGHAAGPASGSPDIVGRLEQFASSLTMNGHGFNDASNAELAREAAQSLRALEAERGLLRQQLGEAEKSGARDRLRLEDIKKVCESLQRQLDQRNDWLEWALGELSALLQSDLIVRGMKGSAQNHLDHIAQIRSAIKGKGGE